MLDVAVEVVGRIADASVGNETLAVVEADEAVPADHLTDHIIRQVPLVGTDGARGRRWKNGIYLRYLYHVDLHDPACGGRGIYVGFLPVCDHWNYQI